MESLRALQRAAQRVNDWHVRVFLTDDGSTDGTAAAASQVGLPLTVIRGNGQLYWNRGMVRAWQSAGASSDRFDGYVLLNDDTILDPDALDVVRGVGSVGAQDAIIVGAVRDPVTGEVTFGGLRRTSRWHPGKLERVNKKNVVQDVDTFNANFVFVPSRVEQRLGTLDPVFTHAMGDLDYGYRARRAGLRVMVLPGTVGVCPRDGARGAWHDPSVPVRDRLRLLASPKGLPRREWEAFLRRHGAPLPWLMSWLPTVRAVFAARS